MSSIKKKSQVNPRVKILDPNRGHRKNFMYLFEKLDLRENSSKRIEVLYLQGKKARQRQSKDLYRCLVSQHLPVPWLELSSFFKFSTPITKFLNF